MADQPTDCPYPPASKCPSCGDDPTDESLARHDPSRWTEK